MSKIKRITVFVFAVLILVANLPLCASAVDPVSAATMANALAQAITAYGASQGVSMTFDVTDTDGIGEGVHELWDQFVTDVNDPNTPTYDSLAVTMWSNLYSKIGSNLGINISATEMPYIDSFWNWLLSGPAEMTKVDNQFYEWTLTQNNEVVPVSVFNVTDMTLNGCPLNALPITAYYGNKWMSIDSQYTVYAIVVQETDPTWYDAFLITLDNTEFYFTRNCSDSSPDTGHSQGQSANSGYRWWNKVAFNHYYVPANVQLTPYISGGKLVDYIGDYSDQSSLLVTSSSDISVRPYIGDAVPQDVYIPDNTDVNYNPTDVAIPLDIPWDNTLFGDGDGTLTDAQSEAAASAADDAITDSLEKTLTIADTQNPDIPAPGEVYVPFLPVTLPNFNFNLSGIWHYVREWISSLGAWFATVLTVWASLPYAMVVPVYATLVVVIVLGVYKRFFM